MTNEKWEFIHSMVLANSRISALLTRDTKIYREGVANSASTQLGGVLTTELRKYYDQYAAEQIPHAIHVENIVALANTVTQACSPILHQGRFRTGIAQKALNLYLKYLWCLDLIPEPPHCPFDSEIIKRLPAPANQLIWTNFDRVEDYLTLVSAARRVAGTQSLAEWELSTWHPQSDALRSDKKTKAEMAR